MALYAKYSALTFFSLRAAVRTASYAGLAGSVHFIKAAASVSANMFSAVSAFKDFNPWHILYNT